MAAIDQPSRPGSPWAPTAALAPDGVSVVGAALGSVAGGIPAGAPEPGDGDVPDGAEVCRPRGILVAL
jgi:hypothetical protein